MHNDKLDMVRIWKIVELVLAYCPPNRHYEYLECENCGSLSHCLDCWIEWIDDDAKTKGD